MTRLLLALLAFYKRWLSPALHSLGGGGCKFQPTCSEYAAEAVALHGAVRGSGLALWRLMRCHPFSRGGFDPVPLGPGDRNFSPDSNQPGSGEKTSPASCHHDPLP